jgi:hypothetical protein
LDILIYFWWIFYLVIYQTFRILKGTALYTSNFAVPTRELEVTPETVLVCCHDGENIFADKTGNISLQHMVIV